MIKLEQLQQLIAVSEHGTISAAAEELHLSQPALTRSLQRMEAELGVTLFDRRHNRATLNHVGRLAVERASGLLQEVEELASELQRYAAKLSTISIGSCGPAPMWSLAAELAERFPEAPFSTAMDATKALLEGLAQGRYRLVLTERPVELPGILCRKYAEEQLCIALPPSHPLSARKSVRLEELAGQSILVYRDMGIWTKFLQKEPRARYLVQADLDSLVELIQASELPAFSSKLVAPLFQRPFARVSVPLEDEEANVNFYLCARESDSALFEALC